MSDEERPIRVRYKIERWSPARGGWIGVHNHPTLEAAEEMAQAYHDATVRDGRSSQWRIVMEPIYKANHVVRRYMFTYPEDDV